MFPRQNTNIQPNQPPKATEFYTDQATEVTWKQEVQITTLRGQITLRLDQTWDTAAIYGN